MSTTGALGTLASRLGSIVLGTATSPLVTGGPAPRIVGAASPTPKGSARRS